jgi:hypothetical protein
VTLKVAVCPAVTVWFAGCVLIAGATAVPAAVKFTPETSAPFKLGFWVAGLNEYPVREGVTV